MSETDLPKLRILEIGAGREEAELLIILMHGLGATGEDFADVAHVLSRSALPQKWRFVLPHAEEIPVTINGGMTMPAWYDIISLTHPREVDWSTVERCQLQIEELMKTEKAPRVILAGFSQGAAMALHVGLRNQSKVDGVLMMSGYLVESEDRPAPAPEGELPITIFHGQDDEVVPLEAAETTLASLRGVGYEPSFQSYVGLPHSVSQEEVEDVFGWLMEQALA
ncbi:MAG: alpha/beta hydrolase [Roseibacillus sp.]